jgi:succinate dehydrogenase / fumarate reductase cytochrome b subunit
MSVSGLALVGFTIMHLLGNLLVFRGPEALNAYAHKLRELGPLLWVARITLIVAVVVHIWTSIALSIENKRARPQPYAKRKDLATSIAARTMMLSGSLFVDYLVYHLMHFTFRTVHAELSQAVDPRGHHDVYAMVVQSFQSPVITAAYIGGVALLCLHLSHGISSTPQTLGLNNAKTIPLASCIVALLLFAGYISIPIAVYAGLVPLR